MTTLRTVNYPRPKPKKVWRLDDLSGGLGGFDWEPGKYYWGLRIDTRRPRIVSPGPLAATLRTGIAANEKTVKEISVGDDIWRITSTTVYRSVGGTAAWVEKGAQNAGVPTASWTVGNPTDIVAFQVSGGNPIIAVAMGSSVVFQYTVDNGATWVASTRAGNAKYANYFAVCAFGRDRPIVKYVTNPNMLWASDDLLNGTSITTPTEVGDAVNDEFNSIIEDDTGVLLMGKRRILWTVDSSGNQYRMGGPYRYKATGDLGTFTGYPTQPGNVPNFHNPQSLDGRIYYVVDAGWTLVEYDHGAVSTNIQPSNFGAALVLRLPITGICVVGPEIWVALSDKPTTSILDNSLWPGRSGLSGNGNAAFYGAGGMYIYAGRRQADGSWVWHGALITNSPFVVRYMSYSEPGALLAISEAAQQAANQANVEYTVPITDSLSAGQTTGSLWLLETQAIRGKGMRLRKFSGTMNAQSQLLRVQYRLARDDEAAPGLVVGDHYTTLNDYSTTYDPITGTRFPPGSTCDQFRLQFIAGPAGSNSQKQSLYSAEIEYEE